MTIDSAALPATASRAGSKQKSFLQFAKSRALVELRIFTRNPQQMFFTFSLPVLFLVLFSAVFGSEDIEGPPGTTPVRFSQYFLPGIIASGIITATFTNIAMTVAIEQHEGLLKRLAGTPLPKSAYFAGKMALAAVVTIIQTALMLTIAVVVYGDSLPSGAGPWFVFAVMLVGGALTGCLLGFAYTRLIPNASSAVAIVQPPFLILQFISGVFFRYSDIPGWLQAVAAIFPLRWIGQGLRYSFLPSWFGESEYGSATWGWEFPTLVILGWLIAAAVLARVFFRWDRTQ